MFHRDWAFIIRYGPVKIMINYESLPEYKLDCIHFGKTLGTMTPSATEARAAVDMARISKNLEGALGFCLNNAGILKTWLSLAREQDSFVHFHPGMADNINDFSTFTLEYLRNVEAFKKMVMTRYFGSKSDS